MLLSLEISSFLQNPFVRRSKDDHILSDTPSPVRSDPSTSPLSDHPSGLMEMNDHHHDGQVGQQGLAGTDDSDGSGDTEDLLRISQQVSVVSKNHRYRPEIPENAPSLSRHRDPFGVFGFFQ